MIQVCVTLMRTNGTRRSVTQPISLRMCHKEWRRGEPRFSVFWWLKMDQNREYKKKKEKRKVTEYSFRRKDMKWNNREYSKIPIWIKRNGKGLNNGLESGWIEKRKSEEERHPFEIESGKRGNRNYVFQWSQYEWSGSFYYEYIVYCVWYQIKTKIKITNNNYNRKTKKWKEMESIKNTSRCFKKKRDQRATYRILNTYLWPYFV